MNGSRRPDNLSVYPLQCAQRLRKHAERLRDSEAAEDIYLDLEASADAIELLLERLAAGDDD